MHYFDSDAVCNLQSDKLLKLSNECSGVKVQRLPPKCSGVKV